MRFSHSRCGNNIYVKSDFLEVLICPSISSRKHALTISSILIKEKGRVKNIEFICLSCDEKLDLKNNPELASVECFRCGYSFDPTNVIVAEESGGPYCKPCASKLFKTEKVNPFVNYLNSFCEN